MKKRVFRERYNLVNGEGKVVIEGMTVEEVKEMIKDAGKEELTNAKEVVINIEPKKRGRKKSVK